MAVAVAVAAIIGISATLLLSSHYRNVWSDNSWTRPVLVTQLLATAAAISGGTYLLVRRPANRCGVVTMVLGIAFGLWYIVFFTFPQHGWWLLFAPTLLYTFRPLLFWLVLAYPIGRLNHASRRLYFAYLVVVIVPYSVFVLTAADNYPVDVWHESTWTHLLTSAWWDVGTLVFVTAILIVVQRKRLRFRGTAGATILGAALLAAVVATFGDLTLVSSGLFRDLYSHGTDLTPYGMVIQVVDLARWGIVVAILAVAARMASRTRAAVMADGSLRERSRRPSVTRMPISRSPTALGVGPTARDGRVRRRCPERVRRSLHTTA